jgi:transmembrane sensor
MTDRAEDPLIEEALRWFVVLRDESHDEDDRRAFERWRTADAAHEAAWQRAQAVWAQADVLEPVYGGSASAAVAPFPESVPTPRRFGRRRWLQAAAAAAIAAPAAYMASRPTLWADHRTAAGERRMVTLADGSTVELAGGSALSVSFGKDQRLLRLLAGEAFFTVAADPARPFVVEAGEGRVRALGTAFDVKMSGESVTVTVMEHRVEVSTGPDRRIELAQGQQVRYVARELQAPRPADIRVADAWRRDRLIFQDAPLGEVVADLERARGGRIVLTDSRLRALPVTAVFDARQADLALATIAGILPITLHRLTDWLIVLSPKG